MEGAATGNTIGGTSAAARNVVSGNTQMGVLLQNAGTTGNTVAGNYIGTNAAGPPPIANGTLGVNIKNSATGNTVGGTTGTAGNVISGNTARASPSKVRRRQATWCRATTSASIRPARAAVANGSHGVYLNGARTNTVGGTTCGRPQRRHRGTAGSGIYIFGAVPRATRCEGTTSAPNAAGTAAVANAVNGVLVEAAPNDTIGGTTAGAGNVISGNSQPRPLALQHDQRHRRCRATCIGTNAAGTAAIPNVVHGVTISAGASSNTIGGTTAGARNVISGNVSRRRSAAGCDHHRQRHPGQLHRRRQRRRSRARQRHVRRHRGCRRTPPSAARRPAPATVIANNGADGVAVVNTSIGNSIQRNTIYANAGLGIDLADDGVTLNNGTKNGACRTADMDFPGVHVGRC